MLVCFGEIAHIAYLESLRTHTLFKGPDDSWTSEKTWMSSR